MTTTLVPALTTRVAPKNTFEIFAHFHDSSLFSDLRKCQPLYLLTIHCYTSRPAQLTSQNPALRIILAV